MSLVEMVSAALLTNLHTLLVNNCYFNLILDTHLYLNHSDCTRPYQQAFCNKNSPECFHGLLSNPQKSTCLCCKSGAPRKVCKGLFIDHSFFRKIDSMDGQANKAFAFRSLSRRSLTKIKFCTPSLELGHTCKTFTDIVGSGSASSSTERS